MNLHNYGFSGVQVAAVGAALDIVFADSVSKPKEEFGVLIGDYNFMAKDDRVFQVGSPPIAGASISSVYCSGSRQGQWMKHLASWTEVAQPFPTHYSTEGNTVSKLDRAFLACPSSLLLKLRTFCSVVGTPEETFSSGLSDHAPISLGFGGCVLPTSKTPPVPRWICKHPNFKMHLESLTSSISIFNLEVGHQLMMYKKCIRAAAKRVRNECLFLDSSGAESTKLVLSSVSRALWFNNLSLAKRLVRYSDIATEPIFIDAGKVCAFSYGNFENTFGDFFKT